MAPTRALDRDTGRTVHVVPVPVRTPAFTASPACVQRAVDAVRILSTLPPHPGLETVLDVIVQDTTMWLVTEYLPGSRALSDLLAAGVLEPLHAARVVGEVLRALRTVHHRRWAHRNITPTSVRVSDSGRIHLTGQALGAVQEALCGYPALPPQGQSFLLHGVDPGEAHRRRLLLIGPVAERWAPEVAGAPASLPLPPVSSATDIWALGVLLCRMAQDGAPYPQDTAQALASAVAHTAPRAAEDCGTLRPVIESMMRRAPEQRPSRGEVQAWLDTLVRGIPEPVLRMPISRLPASGNKPVPEPDWPPDDALPPPARPARDTGWRRHLLALPPLPRPLDERRRPHGTVLVLLVVVLVLAAAVCAILLTAEAVPASANAACPPDRYPATVPVPARHLDPCGFGLTLGPGWVRHQEDRHRVRFTRDGITVRVAPGHTHARRRCTDPLDYQDSEPELAEFRADPHGRATGLRLITIGRTITIAQGTFAWTARDGQALIARNQVLLSGGRFHVLNVRGPAPSRTQIAAVFDRLTATYHPAPGPGPGLPPRPAAGDHPS
ncbi:hypothetical protein ACFYWU_41090 [Streptomyces chrestomyceticus]|uniref:hypothetical protein n=1 Tax=Streptomyces chrestomyceticus TaxID=68185 RepID=UPI003679920E